MQVYDDVRPGDSFEKWHHATCRNYSLTQCRAVPDRAFEASVAVRSCGPFAISRIASRTRDVAALEVRRDLAEIRRDHREDFFVWVGLAGTAVLQQAGQSAQLQAGDLMVMDQARPFTLSFGAESSTLMFIVPRALWRSRVPETESLLARLPRRDAPATHLAFDLAQRCADLCHAKGDGALPQQAWLATLDILGAAFAGVAPVGPPGQGRLRAVQHYLQAHLDDPDLTLETIARAQHVSVRTLIRWFASAGTTPMRWLWSLRLTQARHALESGRFGRVTEVAAAFGFKDLAHFSRAFKVEHGVAPQQLLRSVRPASAASFTRSGPDSGCRAGQTPL